MDFFPYEPFDDNRYPIFTRTGRLNREPDILILHRKLGLWVIECKGCSIGNIKGIQGHEWQMSSWYSSRSIG